MKRKETRYLPKYCTIGGGGSSDHTRGRIMVVVERTVDIWSHVA